MHVTFDSPLEEGVLTPGRAEGADNVVVVTECGVNKLLFRVETEPRARVYHPRVLFARVVSNSPHAATLLPK
jgi:hypothetical protein